MSDRLRLLLAQIEAAPTLRRSLRDRWAAELRAELAEREADPPALETALAAIIEEVELDIEIVKDTQPKWAETRGARVLRTLQYRLRDLALRGTRPATRAEWLAVALDLAEEQGEYSEGLRRQVARQLRGMRLCTPWNKEATYGRTIRSASTGEELALAMETTDNDDDTEWLTYSVHIDGRTSWVQSWARVEEIAAEWLRANGWVRVPGPKEAP